MAMLRLDKILADTGRWSRKEAKELIRAGRVRAAGQIAYTAEEKYDPEGLELTVDGEAVLHARYTYLMMNKPAGVLSATEDRRQGTVLDLLAPELKKRGLFPVGRLDKDTEGLLLLTNHGELAHRLLSPKYHVDKVYLAKVDGVFSEEDCGAFASGMTLGDGLECMPAGLELTECPDEGLITLREGKFHQVKRMCAARGKPVIRLKRLRMGSLILDESLLPGEYRPLTPKETEEIEKSGGLRE